MPAVQDGTDVCAIYQPRLTHAYRLILTIIRDKTGSDATTLDVAEVGHVISVGDRIARVSVVDRAMLCGFGANTTDRLVVEAIVGIAWGMDKKTVAEFATDQDMTDRLLRSGIDYAQGFHIGVPRPVVEIFAQH